MKGHVRLGHGSDYTNRLFLENKDTTEEANGRNGSLVPPSIEFIPETQNSGSISFGFH